MIIWGWTTRELVEREGYFHCPRCRCQQDCKLVRVARYFTLYFIPLCETGNLGQYIQCKGCGAAFDPQALGYDPDGANQEQLQHQTGRRPGNRRKKGGRPIK